MFAARPATGAVYNIGGGRRNAVSVHEARELMERHVGRPLDWHYEPVPRRGDHRWYITDFSRFAGHYGWEPEYGLDTMIPEICDAYSGRVSTARRVNSDLAG
jgi:CDP-paratose 2-epimerase